MFQYGRPFGLFLALAHPLLAHADGQDLIAATKTGDLKRVTQFLQIGEDPNSFDQNRNTALIFASHDGFFEIAQVLVDAGAEVNWQDGEDVTPLILASFKNHPTIVRLLLDHGAKRDIRDKWDRSALTYALRRGVDDPIALMLAE